MSEKNTENGIFINGRKQVIELLKKMDYEDKLKLLKNLRNKNPSLARELAESCISFETLFDLNDKSLKIIVSQASPAILGLALYLTTPKNQRKILSLLSRESAIRAFDIMKKDLAMNREDCLRAQEKILQIALDLQKNKIIQLY